MKTLKDKNYSYQHTKQRLSERHNLTLSEYEYNNLCQKFIEKKIKIIVEEKSNNQVIFETTFKNKQIKFVWNNSHQLITTTLT